MTHKYHELKHALLAMLLMAVGAMPAVAQSGSTVSVVHNDSEVYTFDTREVWSIRFLDGKDFNLTADGTGSLAEAFAANPEFCIFSKLLQVTGWDKTLSETRADVLYSGEIEPKYFVDTKFYAPQIRRELFTVFAESDAVFASSWGLAPRLTPEGEIENWASLEAAIKAKATEAYGTAAPNDPANPDNALNRFVAAHIVKGGMGHARFVHHFNEYGYDYGADVKEPQTETYSVNVWNYYATAGKYPELLKITQLPLGEHDYYINRVSVHDAGLNGSYAEIGTVAGGILVKPLSYSFGSMNGLAHQLAEPLIFDDATRKAMASERIRIDLASVQPELHSNYVLGIGRYYFPADYLENVRMNEGTIYYLQDGYVAYNGGWKDYQGDEFMLTDNANATFKLPPVPETGTYQFRLGASCNPSRGRLQICISHEPEPENADEEVRFFDLTATPDDLGLQLDEGLSNSQVVAADRALMRKGIMKGPRYITMTGSKGLRPIRDVQLASQPAIRIIVGEFQLQKNRPVYMHIQQMGNSKAQLPLDYVELVPESVYNGSVPEDVW